ncbi:MAG: SUMF1/EgtB/PvdO family nonheme iron enzyme [Candidatus Tectomicrobia bacterium]|nr:SUMF1/EgtB/PvdO family nonheme iron enzyme [Candidatus Tectomicrobia bacterium]
MGESVPGQCRHANGADLAAKRQNLGWTVVSCDDRHSWTSPVGTYTGNGFGLQDVLGNVWEWVQDCSNDSYNGAPGDGRAWERGECGHRVVRGGSWIDEPAALRAANRGRDSSDYRFNLLGLRIARTLAP